MAHKLPLEGRQTKAMRLNVERNCALMGVSVIFYIILSEMKLIFVYFHVRALSVISFFVCYENIMKI